ncbi:MAG TPA: NapC/NirT family cytochrome c [Terriglobales bacterium]|nr:NapC/NirT family cytochrome c [Terriglobales bacterium]
MTGQTDILIVLIAVTAVLATMFLIRPNMTAGATGKILAFVGLFVLPALCVAGGISVHTQRSEETQFCISCHSMEPFGRSLYVDDPKYIPAIHFQDHRVPAGQACFACHADYSLFGPLRDKLRGVTRIYMQYVSRPPNPIRIPGGYNNDQCLYCHAGARNFIENPIHSAIMDTLTSNQLSCVSSGCHDLIHNVSELDHLKFWKPER